MPETRPVSRIDDVLVSRRVVEIASDLQDGASRQQRRSILLVCVGFHPVVIVAGAVQRLDLRAIDCLQGRFLCRNGMAWLEDESSMLFTGEVEGNLFVRNGVEQPVW